MFLGCKIILKLSILITVLFSTTEFCNAQDNRKIDSLRNVIANQPSNKVKLGSLIDLAYEFFYVAKYDSTISYLEKAYIIAESQQDSEGFADYYEALGIVFIVTGKYLDAADNYFKALPYREQLNDPNNLGNLYRKIGDAHSLLLKTNEALTYYSKALKCFKSDDYKKAICLNNMGNNYRRAKNYKAALDTYDKSIFLYTKFEPTKGLANTYEEMGICYSEMGNSKKAEELLLKAYELALKLPNDKPFRIHVLNELVKHFSNVNEPDKVIQYATIGIPQMEEHKSYKLTYESSEAMYKAYKSKKNLTKALNFLEKMQNNRNEIIKQDQQKLASNISIGYQLEKRQQEGKLQAIEIQEQRRKNQYLIVGTLVFFLMSSFLAYGYYEVGKQRQKVTIANDKLATLNNTLEEKVEERTYELSSANQRLEEMNQEIIDSMVKGQTVERKRVASDLHDNLGGQVTALRWSLMTLENASFTEKQRQVYNNIKNLTEKTYHDVRDMSHNLYPEGFEQGGFILALETFVSKVNISDKLSFEVDLGTYKELPKKTEFELYCIISELITNTIKHSDATEVSISSSESDNSKIEIIYQDNGTQFNQKAFSTGKGLKNIQERVASINGQLFLNDENFRITVNPNLHS